MELHQLYKIYTENKIVSTDTRKILTGCIFFALKGDNFDGNNFAETALEQGASYAIVDNSSVVKNEKYILVHDVLTTLQKLANYHRKQLKIPVLAITGSNGKTTTKELCRNVLSQKFNTKATKGNLNNHIGVPLTILDTDSSIEFLIVEMGANHQGEIENLCNIAEPDFVMITNIGKAHMEGFGGIEGIMKGKSEMYKYANLHGAGIFINTDDKVLLSLIPPKSKLIEYAASALVQLVSEEPLLILKYKNIDIQTKLFGSYNISNVVFSIALGEYFGINPTLIARAIEDYLPDNNRSQMERIAGNTYIKDAYNANPSSMKLSLESFAKLDAPKKLVILGDMLELGEFKDQEHLAIIELVEQLGFTEKLFVGPIFFKFKPANSPYFYKDIATAKNYFESQNFENYFILLKGSRGLAIENIISNK